MLYGNDKSTIRNWAQALFTSEIDIMTSTICLDGVEIAKDIKKRSRALKRTVKSVCKEAKISYRTYCSWQQGENNPSFAKLKPIYAVLDAIPAPDATK
jgi:hypothetical protein